MGYFIKQSGAVTYNPANGGEIQYVNGASDTVTLAKAGAVTPVIDSFLTAGASAGPYAITVNYGAGGDYDFDTNNPVYLRVYIDSVYQDPLTAYTVTDSTITFVTVPPNGLTVTVVHGTYSTDVPNANIF